MALTSLTSLNSLTFPFAKVEYYIKVLLKLQKSPFRDSERTFRDLEPPFRDLERPFRITERRFIHKRKNKFITNEKQ